MYYVNILSLSLYIYMYIYIYIHVCVYIYIYIYTHIWKEGARIRKFQLSESNVFGTPLGNPYNLNNIRNKLWLQLHLLQAAWGRGPGR